MASVEEAKKMAAFLACEREKDTIMKAEVIGLGTGSTIKYFIDKCVRENVLENKIIVSSSLDTVLYILNKNIKACLYDLFGLDKIDIYIDGADEVSNRLDLIKGRGAALFREKYLALNSVRRVYIVDYTKFNNKDYLYRKPIPVEVIPMTIRYVFRKIIELGIGQPRIRMGVRKDGPVITDNYGLIIDIVDYKYIYNALDVDRMIKQIHGVLATGLFPRDLVDILYVGYKDEVKIYSGSV